jgi:hypothetical protein
VLAVTVRALQVAVSTARGRLAAIIADRHLLALLLAGGSVYWFAIFQALFEYGDNGRYAIPTQQIAVAFVMLYTSWLIERRAAIRSSGSIGKVTDAPANPPTSPISESK